MKIKTTGILELGKETTTFYKEELNTAYTKQTKGKNMFPIQLLRTNFNEINNLLPKPSKQLEEIIQTYLDELLKLGVAQIIIPNITLHETIDNLKFNIPIIHPVHLTASEIKKNKYKKVVLFGSKYTMESNYVKNIFKQYDIITILPSKDDMLFIDNIRKVVYHKTTSKELIDDFNLMVKKYAQNNAMVIACTELSVASINGNRKIFDMARIQIKEILKIN